jgi:putative ABC transport system substrate-binding protein
LRNSFAKGARPAGPPALQPTKFESVIDLQTTRALGVEAPLNVFSVADEAIE